MRLPMNDGRAASEDKRMVSCTGLNCRQGRPNMCRKKTFTTRPCAAAILFDLAWEVCRLTFIRNWHAFYNVRGPRRLQERKSLNLSLLLDVLPVPLATDMRHEPEVGALHLNVVDEKGCTPTRHWCHLA